MLIGRRGTQCKSQTQGGMALGWHCWKSPCVRVGVWLVHHMRIRMLSAGEKSASERPWVWRISRPQATSSRALHAARRLFLRRVITSNSLNL